MPAAGAPGLLGAVVSRGRRGDLHAPQASGQVDVEGRTHGHC